MVPTAIEVDHSRVMNSSRFRRIRVVAIQAADSSGDVPLIATEPLTRLTQAFRLCVSRMPSNLERQQLTELLATNREWYRTHPDDAKQLNGSIAISGTSPDESAAWIATARILLNLDEFITRE